MREVCHCTHAKESHALLRTEGGNVYGRCLALGCDDCKGYVQEDQPKPPPDPASRPNHIASCLCSRCKEFVTT